ncbi:hypothetical protein [uncultured Shimia sp.]|uniref:hypothetical protein n=1 Tax=uncultured Shimia sp. TaxID=573152 RepID=UPI002619E521|nr:hypothetical protein [uncultured Shimia sp.]
MLNLLGTIAGNVLSLPGILGLGLGMMTRNIVVAAVLGALVGIGDTMIFAKFQMANIDALEMAIAVLVGVLAGMVGCAIRRKGVAA